MWSVVSSSGVPAGNWSTGTPTSSRARSCRPSSAASGPPISGARPPYWTWGSWVSKFALSPLRSRRTPALIRRGDPEPYQLALLRKGATSMSPHRNECTVGAGDLTLWEPRAPRQHDARGRRPGTGDDPDVPPGGPAAAPRAAGPAAGPPDTGRRRSRGDPASFMTALEDHAAGCEPQELRRLGAAAVDLAVACLAQHLDAEDRLPSEARAEVLLRRIHAFIEHNSATRNSPRPTSRPATASRYAASTSSSTAAGRASGPGSADAAWNSAAPTWAAPNSAPTGCSPSPPAGASADPWSSAVRSARPTGSAPRNSAPGASRPGVTRPGASRQ